jgi:hypothetical protein
MRAHVLSWKKDSGWSFAGDEPVSANLVFYFGTRAQLEAQERYAELRQRFPNAHVLGCSTGGQISGDEVFDDEIAGVSLAFDHTNIRLVHEEATDADTSFECGVSIGRKLQAQDLAGIFVLSDGLSVNGSRLVAGITSVVGNDVPLTGGLAGDGDAFGLTVVGADFAPRPHVVAAVGFYGNAVRIGHGSAGGWDQFGPRRRITRSSGNVLYELDNEPALDLYDRYLGDEADGLPSTGLLFPLRIYDPAHPEQDIVRTILAVDRSARSLRFAGDVPEGWVAQLMRGNFDRLAAGAAEAARAAQASLEAAEYRGDEVALIVSCIGRRLLMGQHTVDEVEAADAELGGQVARVGFYSYGEISPHHASGVSQLHNQTMTITTISEAA